MSNPTEFGTNNLPDVDSPKRMNFYDLVDHLMKLVSVENCTVTLQYQNGTKLVVGPPEKDSK